LEIFRYLGDFISRWGTHYIKSAKFGGQLEIRKLQSGLSTSSKEEFAVEAEMEYKGLFASGGAYSSTKSGSSKKSEEKFMSTSVQALGGSQKIAAAVTDLYTPTLKNTLVVSFLLFSVHRLTINRVHCSYRCIS
jgi:sensor domain CHASE-containing protein